MKVSHRSSVSYEQACGELARRLRERSAEIEVEVHARIQERAPVEQTDPEYIHGLNAAVRDAIAYTLTTVETGETAAPPLPTTLLGQARLAARHGVTVATVLRRYTLGAHQVRDLILAEALRSPALLDEHLQRLLREQDFILECVLLELEREHARELQNRPSSLDAHLADLVKRLLAGRPVNTADLDYDFDRHHIGLVTQGNDSVPSLRKLARTVDGRLLLVKPGADAIWAWIGIRHRLDPDQLPKRQLADWSPSIRLGIGEPGTGPLGWSQTHRQAREAFPFALRERSTVVRYTEIALQAAAERDALAALALRQTYVVPLKDRSDADSLLRTLRAYFAAGRNAAATGAALGISRQTVSKRLQLVENVIRRPLTACAADLEITLRLEDLRG